jgi:endonuclease/exonuclease/phosphatase family metal-dependent hydrolase
MTYNVHRCVGRGGKDSIGEIASLCAEAQADIIAMQELDAPETDSPEHDGQVHHARDLAAELDMTLLFCRTFRRGVGYYGHALLSRTPLELMRVTTFSANGHPNAEPRGAIWARTNLGTKSLDVISTHLGVGRRERQAQSEALVTDWLDSPELGHPVILCGDLNAVPNATTYRRLASRLRDAQRLHGRPKATFPSAFPILRLDHVFVSNDVEVRGVTVPYNSRSRRASDHLPLIVDLELP